MKGNSRTSSPLHDLLLGTSEERCTKYTLKSSVFKITSLPNEIIAMVGMKTWQSIMESSGYKRQVSMPDPV
jgi:hypothetical protein